MKPAKRIVVNTLAQHIRSVINICLSLYSTRLVLLALGQSDYGIYSLVASVVAMLGFMTNAMVVTTQRQLSFLSGKGDMDEVKAMFSNSLLVHIIIAAILGVILWSIGPLIFNGFLIIEASRLHAASIVYILVVASLIISFLTAPYRALFITRENIVYISIIDVLDGVIKLVAAIWLMHCPFDRLITYAFIMTGIMVFNYLGLVVWAQTHFEESILLPRRSYFNRQHMTQLANFGGWTLYSVACIAGRNQGTAILLNNFFGTVINASYGIALQVFGSVQFVAQSVLNAMSPQLIKAEGSGDRQHMLHMAELSSKYAFLLLSLAIIPLTFEIPTVLKVWLGNVPPHTVLFCRAILIALLIDQITIGLGTANQAIGRIRNYSIVINTIKILSIPIMWILLRTGHSLEVVMVSYVAIELICAAIRLPFLKYTSGLSIRHFTAHVIIRVLPALTAQALVGWSICTLTDIPLRFLLTGAMSVIVGIITIWLTALEQAERSKALEIIRRRHA